MGADLFLDFRGSDMLLKYPLTDSQYARFQHANNNEQIQDLGRKAGVVVTDETMRGGNETMFFSGRCSGIMSLVPCDANRESVHPLATEKRHHWECWIQVRSKPWWLPWSVLDWGFRRALV